MKIKYNPSPVPTSEFLYFKAITESNNQSCKFRIRCTFKNENMNQSKMNFTSRKNEFDEMGDWDFSKFHLGNGTIDEKQARVKSMVQQILTDNKQLRLCKERLTEIKRARKMIPPAPQELSMAESSIASGDLFFSNDFVTSNVENVLD